MVVGEEGEAREVLRALTGGGVGVSESESE